MGNQSAPKGPQSIFTRILAGYVAVTLLAMLLTGLVSFWLVRKNIIQTNLDDLLSKAGAVAEMLSRSDGRVRVLTLKGLQEIEALTDAQLIYVGSDMVARQMPTKDFQKPKTERDENGQAAEKDNWPEGVPYPPQGLPFLSGAISSVAGSRLTSSIQEQKEGQTGAYGQGESLDGDEAQSTAQPEAREQDAAPVQAMAQAQQTVQPQGEGQEGMEDENVLLRFNLAGSVDEQLMRSILEGRSATDVRELQFVEGLVMFAGTPIVDSESADVLAAIILCRPITDVSRATGQVLWMMALACAAALICAAVLAWFMGRRIAQPVVALSNIAGRMAEGHYGERFQVTSADEIGRLGGTLNLLSARLSETIGTLSDEKTKLEKILSAIGEGIIAIDREGRVIHHNGAALNLLELKAWEVRPDDPHALEHQRQLIEMLHSSMVEGERIVTNWQTVTGRTIEAIASPVISNQGEASGAVCLVRDISEAQRLEQMRRDYIANISHELRTPLTGIRGMVEPLLDGLMETEEERQNCYQVIYQETIRLEKLIGEMLDMSRLQAGRIQLELEPMEPQGLLEAAARRMQSRAQEGEVELAVEAEPDLMVMGDEDRILQVLIILTDNALSFTPPGGKVTLFARKAGEGRVALGVSDTGAGIDPVDLPYIWERFYKADRSRMRTSGTGLGLSIAKLVVELMQGKIDVQTQVGKGSTFTFILQEAKDG